MLFLLVLTRLSTLFPFITLETNALRLKTAFPIFCLGFSTTKTPSKKHWHYSKLAKDFPTKFRIKKI